MAGSLAARVTVPTDVLVQEVSGETVLLSLETERYYGLNQVGTRMWELLAESGDVKTVFQKLLEEFEVDESTLRSDLTELIEDLVDDGLLSVEPELSATGKGRCIVPAEIP